MTAAIRGAAHSTGGRRVSRPLLALAAAAVSGGVQTVLAQWCGVVRFDDTRSGWQAVELGTLMWLSAVSIVLGVLLAERFGQRGRGRLLTLGAAVLGGLFAVPLTTSAAAWGAMYGGDVPAVRAGVSVLVGIVVGTGFAALAQRWRAVGVGLAVGICVVWVLALLSVTLGPPRPPILGHPDLGLGRAGSAAAPRVGALAAGLGSGLLFGIGWSTAPLESRVLAAASGPALSAVVLLLAVPVATAGWPWSPVPGSLLSVPCAVLGAALGTGLRNGPPRYLR